MGEYAYYVWSAFGVAAVLLCFECLQAYFALVKIKLALKGHVK